MLLAGLEGVGVCPGVFRPGNFGCLLKFIFRGRAAAGKPKIKSAKQARIAQALHMYLAHPT